MKDDNRMISLHGACMKSKTDISIDLIVALVEASLDSCTIAGKDGKIPMHLLKDIASCKDALSNISSQTHYTLWYWFLP